MAQPPSVQRLYSDDYKGAPNWFKLAFLNTLNLFVFPVYNALNKNLTMGQNLNEMPVTFQLTGSATPTNNTISFISPIQGDPIGVNVINVQITGVPTTTYPTAAVQCFWSFDGTSIQIGAITGLSNGVNYSITVRVQ